MTRQTPKRRRIGRPTAGAGDDEKVTDYPQLSVRLPAEVRATLQALSVIESRPQWRVIRDAIDCYAKSRSESERRLIAELAGRSRARVSRRE